MLTKVGQLEAFQLGFDVENRYLGFRQPAKVWTSTAERTVKSAKSFIDGLVMNANETMLVEVSEADEEAADSLTPYQGCPAYSSSRGSKQSQVSTHQHRNICSQTNHSTRSSSTSTPSPSSRVSALKSPTSTGPKTTSSACKSFAATKPSSVAVHHSVHYHSSRPTSG